MTNHSSLPRPSSRRTLLRRSAAGFGLLGLRGLMAAESAPASLLAPKTPHFAPKAKRIIFLMVHGGPSSIDTFDPKPCLERDNGKPIPFKRGLTFGETSVGGLMKPLWPFKLRSSVTPLKAHEGARYCGRPGQTRCGRDHARCG